MKVNPRNRTSDILFAMALIILGLQILFGVFRPDALWGMVVLVIAIYLLWD